MLCFDSVFNIHLFLHIGYIALLSSILCVLTFIDTFSIRMRSPMRSQRSEMRSSWRREPSPFVISSLYHFFREQLNSCAHNSKTHKTKELMSLSKQSSFRKWIGFFQFFCCCVAKLMKNWISLVMALPLHICFYAVLIFFFMALKWEKEF